MSAEHPASQAPARGRFDKASVRDADVGGRTVLLRCDLNVPLAEGRVEDDTRIRASLPTIELLRERGAGTVLVSHLGRPEGREPELSMGPVGARLSELLGAEVRTVPEVVGEAATREAGSLGPGELLLLENSRYERGETENAPALADALAQLAEVYVDDAFGSAHRAHATTVGVAERLPAYAGLLLEREVRELTALLDDPARPFVVALGGAKVSDKAGVIDRFLQLADRLLIGGAMAFSFLRAQGHATGDSLVSDDGVALASEALERAGGADCELALPADLVIADRLEAGAERRELDGVDVPDGWMGLDIGPRTARSYAKSIGRAATVFWNGPMGVFELEPFAAGTRALAQAVAETAATTVVGGGDSVAAVTQMGLADRVGWLSTGGGASLELVEGKPLPGVEALMEASDD